MKNIEEIYFEVEKIKLRKGKKTVELNFDDLSENEVEETLRDIINNIMRVRAVKSNGKITLKLLIGEKFASFISHGGKYFPSEGSYLDQEENAYIALKKMKKKGMSCRKMAEDKGYKGREVWSRMRKIESLFSEEYKRVLDERI